MPFPVNEYITVNVDDNVDIDVDVDIFDGLHQVVLIELTGLFR